MAVRQRETQGRWHTRYICKPHPGCSQHCVGESSGAISRCDNSIHVGSVVCDNSIHVGSVVCDNSIRVGSIVCINNICDPGGESSVSHEWIVMVVSGARCMVTPRGWGWGGVLIYPHDPRVHMGWSVLLLRVGTTCITHLSLVMDISRCILLYKRVICSFDISWWLARAERGEPLPKFLFEYIKIHAAP